MVKEPGAWALDQSLERAEVLRRFGDALEHCGAGWTWHEEDHAEEDDSGHFDDAPRCEAGEYETPRTFMATRGRWRRA